MNARPEQQQLQGPGATDHHGEGVADDATRPVRHNGMVPLDPVACAQLVASARWRTTPGPDGCVLWTGATTSNGYGRVWLDGRMVYAHRVALVAALGRDLAPGTQAGHLCHDRAHAAGTCAATTADPCSHRLCVNPAHLTEQDARTNTLASGSVTADHAARTHCQAAGHRLAGANLRPDKLRSGQRGCTTCKRDWTREQRRLIRSAALALGLSWRAYTARYGWSTVTARTVLADLAAGQRPLGRAS